MKATSNGSTASVDLLDHPPLDRQKLGGQVLDRLLKMVEMETIKPGDQLPSERALMSAFRVGRPAVREALQSMEQMGMIAIHHGERARLVSATPDMIFEKIRGMARHVLQTSPGTLDQLKEARLMFEQAMVRQAALKATEEDIAKLRVSVEMLAPTRRSTAEFITADMLFHKTIAAISGNSLFAAISEAMLDWLTHFSVETIHQPGTETLTLAEHTRILKKIIAHDENGAAKAMKDHLTRANKLYSAIAKRNARKHA